MEIHDKVIHLKSGGQAVLIHDEVASASSFDDSIRLEESTPRHARIFVRECDLADARNRFAGIPVYGFWQTFLASHSQDLTYDGYILEIDKEHTRGQALTVKNGKAIGSEPYLGSLPISASGNLYYITEKDLQELVAPRQAALLPREVEQTRKRELRRAAILSATVALAGLVIAFCADLALASAANKRVTKAKAITAEAEGIEAQVAQLTTEINPITELVSLRNRAILTRLGELIAKSDQAKLPLLPLTASADATFEVAKLPTGVSFDVIAIATPAYPLTITMSLDGTAPPTAPASPQ